MRGRLGLGALLQPHSQGLCQAHLLLLLQVGMAVGQVEIDVPLCREPLAAQDAAPPPLRQRLLGCLLVPVPAGKRRGLWRRWWFACAAGLASLRWAATCAAAPVGGWGQGTARRHLSRFRDQELQGKKSRALPPQSELHKCASNMAPTAVDHSMCTRITSCTIRRTSRLAALSHCGLLCSLQARCSPRCCRQRASTVSGAAPSPFAVSMTFYSCNKMWAASQRVRKHALWFRRVHRGASPLLRRAAAIE